MIYWLMIAGILIAFLASWFDVAHPITYMCKAGHGLKTTDELHARRWWEKHQDCEKTLHEG